MTDKPLLPELPQLKLKKFDYDEPNGILDIELEESDFLNEYVQKELNLDHTATHEETEKFFIEIIAKALAGTDGYNFAPASDFENSEKEESAPSIIV